MLIDDKMKAWILEVNDHPSLNIYFDTEFMNHKPQTEEDVCPIDLYVKSRVVRDAISLVKKKSFEEYYSFRSLQQIYPTEDDTVSSLIKQTEKLFSSLAKIRE